MPNSKLPQTLLGFDFGMKRIGVAVGQTVTSTATPLASLKAVNGRPNWSEVDLLIKRWSPDALVVGVPLNIDGSEQTITFAASYFANKLSKHYQLPVYNIDERYTTKEAKQTLFDQGGSKRLEKMDVDSWAAKLILESWLASFSR